MPFSKKLSEFPGRIGKPIIGVGAILFWYSEEDPLILILENTKEGPAILILENPREDPGILLLANGEGQSGLKGLPLFTLTFGLRRRANLVYPPP